MAERIEAALAAYWDAYKVLMRAAEDVRQQGGKDPAYLFAVSPLDVVRAASTLARTLESDLPALKARLGMAEDVIAASRYYQAAYGTDDEGQAWGQLRALLRAYEEGSDG